jgi:electron transport complex protein RnfG
VLDMIKMGLKLLLITAVAALLLGGANILTRDAIDEQERLASDQARRTVLQAERFEQQEVLPEEETGIPGIVEVYAGYNGEELAGYTIKVRAKGYGGPVEVTVGYIADRITGVSISAKDETPGLGAEANKQAFMDRFKDKTLDQPLQIVKGGAAADNQVDAITGATVTSKAVSTAINNASLYFMGVVMGGAAA